MEITVDDLKRKFDQFNRLMFAGKLPSVPIELTYAKTFVGKCAYKQRRLLGKTVARSDFRLRFSTFYDLPEREVEDVLIHEMIHLHILYNRIPDTSAHGMVFCKMMNAINQRFDRHITITHRSSPEQRDEALNRRVRWHVVALIDMNDGKTGFKVLPRVVESVLHYYRNVMASGVARGMKLYLTSDTFFNRYPCSSALKVYYAEREQLQSHLEGARPIVCDGKTLTVVK